MPPGAGNNNFLALNLYASILVRHIGEGIADVNRSVRTQEGTKSRICNFAGPTDLEKRNQAVEGYAETFWTKNRPEWRFVRALGELQILTRASYVMLAVVPLLAGVWTALPFDKMVYLPRSWLLAFFCSPCCCPWAHHIPAMLTRDRAPQLP